MQFRSMVRARQLDDAQAAELLPALSIANRVALDCWHAIGEFSLAEALLWADVHEMEDPEDLIARLVIIRDGTLAQG